MMRTERALDNVLALAEKLCRERGVRLTRQRQQVLELICASNHPLGAYDILEQLRGMMDNPTPPTVYRALEFLLEQGLIHKIESLHAYIGCSHPEHPHSSQFLICSDCGEVNEIESDEISRGLHNAVKSAGFKSQRPVIELLGTCAHCQTRKADKHLES